MRIYVAGKYGPNTNARVREVHTQLRAAGHVITYDWTGDEQVSTQQAMNDLNGVLTADAFVLIAESHDVTYTGSLVELGIALGIGLPIYLLGDALMTSRDRQESCIFMHLPQIAKGEAAFTADLLDGGLGDEHLRS